MNWFLVCDDFVTDWTLYRSFTRSLLKPQSAGGHVLQRYFQVSPKLLGFGEACPGVLKVACLHRENPCRRSAYTSLPYVLIIYSLPVVFVCNALFLFLLLFFWPAPVAFRRVALETPEWTSRDSNHHRQSVSAGKTNAIPTEPSGRLCSSSFAVFSYVQTPNKPC